MRNIVIYTTFYESKSGYSLVSVVETQIKMLIEHGYNPIVLVQENFDYNGIWQPQYIDIRAVIPPLDDDDFDSKLEIALNNNLKNADVCITHDIIYQSFYENHNRIMREIDFDLLWLHWIHSRPNRKYESPKGYIIYPNQSDIDNVKKCYNTENVIANRASHSINPLEFGYDSLTIDLVNRSDLIGGDVNCIYPRGADSGKQTHKVIRLLSGVKKLGYDVRLLIIDWQSQGARFQSYMDSMYRLCEQLDLIDEIKFSSRLDDRCSQGIPRKNILELFNLANVYIHASNSETYGLVPHEAMLRGNLVCLNYDWQPMHELFGNNAIYFDFGSVTKDRTYVPDEQTFWNNEAKRLIDELNKNRALIAKTNAQKQWIPKNMWKDFESLLYLSSPH